MPSASELARREEEEQPATDDSMTLDGLQTRAKRLGFNSIGEALDFVEQVLAGEL